MAKKSGIGSMSWLLKIILVVVYDIYGIIRRISTGKTLPVIIGVLQIFTGNFFGILWLIDLITVLINKDATVLV